MKRIEDTENDEKAEMSSKKAKLSTQELDNSLKFEPGKWLVHLSTPIEFNSIQNEVVEKLVEFIKFKAKNVPEIKSVCKLDEFHLSVSRPFLLKNSQSKLLLENIEKFIKDQNKFEAKINKFTVLENKSESYEYETDALDSDRKIFVGFEILSSDDLKNLVKNVDSALKSSSKSIPQYYKDPIFHVSFMYVCTQPKSKNDCVQIIEQIVKDFNFEKSEHGEIISMERLKTKCGNKYYFFKLK